MHQANMLFSLIEKLPIDVVGATVLHYLDIQDIVRLERACASKSSHQHFLNLLPRRLPVKLYSCHNRDIACFEWFAKRNCKIKCVTIRLPGNNPALHVKNLLVESLDLSFDDNVTMENCTYLFKSNLICRVKRINVFADQNKEVIDQLSLLTGKVKKLNVLESHYYEDWLNRDILSRWKLKEIDLDGDIVTLSTITTIVQICTELTRVILFHDNIDNSIVIAIAQHCSKLKTLKISICSNITYNSLLALSERKLYLKELDIPIIPHFPTADIARRCSHALSCIRRLDTNNLHQNGQDASIILPYMTELTCLLLNNDCQFYLPLLAQYCHKLTCIRISKCTNSIDAILSLCRVSPLLDTLACYDCIGITDTILIELIHACPHLHTLYLPYETEITDISILALSEHYPPLQFLVIRNCTQVTEAAVLQLLQRCRKLTRLGVSSSSLSEETWTQLDKNTQKRVSR